MIDKLSSIRCDTVLKASLHGFISARLGDKNPDDNSSIVNAAIKAYIKHYGVSNSPDALRRMYYRILEDLLFNQTKSKS